MHSVITTIVDVFGTSGASQYGGERVSQIEHALQCAHLADAAGATETLVAACLLHDLGHLIHELGENPAGQGIDDLHQFRSLHLLRRAFPDSVLEPIRLHVEAKRYLCATDPQYAGNLSAASQRSLELQGGIMDTAEATTFSSLAHAPDAIALRRWDDLAKVPGASTPGLDHFLPLLMRCAQ